MNVKEIIQEFIPCEVCGNRDINNFYLHVLAHKGSLPFVKCGSCAEEHHFRSVNGTIVRITRTMKEKSMPMPVLSGVGFGNFEWVFHAKVADKIHNTDIDHAWDRE